MFTSDGASYSGVTFRMSCKPLCWWGIFLCCFLADVGADKNVSSLKLNVSSSWLQNDTCSEVHDVPNDLKCKFVRNVTDCQPDGGLINYFVFTHCWMPNNLIPLSAVILFLWLIYLFMFLGATAEDYFCPALKVMSDNLRLNQNLAGVTLLALGNGAPDIFGAYAAITQAKQGDAGLAIGAIFGAGIFVTTVVVGAVSFSFSFTLTQRPFLRDVIFYIIAVFCTFFAIWDHKMYWWEGAGFVVLYIIYVLVVFIGRLVYQKLLKKKLGVGDIPRVVTPPSGKELGENSEPCSPTNESDYYSISNGTLLSAGPQSPVRRGFPSVTEETEESGAESEIASPQFDIESQQNFDRDTCGQAQLTDDESVNDNDSLSDSPDAPPVAVLPKTTDYRHIRRTISGALEVGGVLGVSVVARSSPHMERRPRDNTTETTPLLLAQFKSAQKPEHPAVKMLKGLSPINGDFKQQRLWWKIITILKAPVTILLAATIPLVDDSERDHCWNKWLNICHCVISPCFILLITKAGLHTIDGVFPIGVIPIIPGLVIAVIVALTSTSGHPPRYHFLFAWMGFAVAIVWIYCLANEIVNMLQALGVIINLTHAVLGLTLLAWGNSIGDAISNYTMAKQGFSRMAISACFGGPLLNMLIGIGVASIFKAINSGGHFRIDFTDVEFVCVCFLLLSLLSSLILVTLVLRFRIHRLYGIWLLVLYIVFIVMAILTGTKVIKIKHDDT